jgi:endogenous inhibitor of DNA gyrase (YacG/DUF329 family)
MHPALLGGLAGGAAVLAIALLQPRRDCPDCGTPLPRFRTPSTGRQAISGGWSCPKCGISIDRKGRKRDPQ